MAHNWEQHRQWESLIGEGRIRLGMVLDQHRSRTRQSPFQDRASNMLDLPYGAKTAQFRLTPDASMAVRAGFSLPERLRDTSWRTVVSDAEVAIDEFPVAFSGRASTSDDVALSGTAVYGDFDQPFFVRASGDWSQSGTAAATGTVGCNVRGVTVLVNGSYPEGPQSVMAAVSVGAARVGALLRPKYSDSGRMRAAFEDSLSRRAAGPDGLPVLLDLAGSYGAVHSGEQKRHQVSVRTLDGMRALRAAFVQERVYNGRLVSLCGDFVVRHDDAPLSEHAADKDQEGPRRILRVGGSWQLSQSLEMRARATSEGKVGAAMGARIPLPLMWLDIVTSVEASLRDVKSTAIFGVGVTLTQRDHQVEGARRARREKFDRPIAPYVAFL